MMGNSASYSFNSQCIYRLWIAIEPWRIACMYLQITNKHSYIKFTYCLDRSIINEVLSTNQLSSHYQLLIQSLATWSDNVTRIVAKANSVLGFLQRNFKYCSPEIKASCFKSLIIPILEYWCTSWFPRLQKDIYAIEMVQRRVVRFIFNDYSYNTSVTSLLNILNWPTLQNHRINLRAMMLYIIINHLIDTPADTLLIHNFSSTCYHHHYYRVATILQNQCPPIFLFTIFDQDLEPSEPSDSLLSFFEGF